LGPSIKAIHLEIKKNMAIVIVSEKQQRQSGCSNSSKFFFEKSQAKHKLNGGKNVKTHHSVLLFYKYFASITST
jgi:hypothetical protein